MVLAVNTFSWFGLLCPKVKSILKYIPANPYICGYINKDSWIGVEQEKQEEIKKWFSPNALSQIVAYNVIIGENKFSQIL